MTDAQTAANVRQATQDRTESVMVSRDALHMLISGAMSAHNRLRHCYGHETDFMNRQRLEDVAAGLEMDLKRFGSKIEFPVTRWREDRV